MLYLPATKGCCQCKWRIGELCVFTPAHSPINVFLPCTDPLHVLPSSSAFSLSSFPFALVERWNLCLPSFDSFAVVLRPAVFYPIATHPFGLQAAPFSVVLEACFSQPRYPSSVLLPSIRTFQAIQHMATPSIHMPPLTGSFDSSTQALCYYLRPSGRIQKKDVTKRPRFRKEVRSRVRSYVSACSCAKRLKTPPHLAPYPEP
ncbi:hypothetical protein EDB83DRAFT_2347473 [Lactarius deliciosus]|nr:hypothetical protein EDB83DRAFT_2347473 [Lactarius deliciosus]